MPWRMTIVVVISLAILPMMAGISSSSSMGLDGDPDCKDDDHESVETPRKNPRIIGGIPSPEGAWPMMVYYRSRSTEFFIQKQMKCGGTIIAKKFILTAAHCVNETYPNREIFAGKINIDRSERNEQRRRVVSTLRHPYYTGSRSSYDIAILKLDKPLDFNSKVFPAYLPDENEELPVGTEIRLVGFGRIRPDQDDANLHHAKLRVGACRGIRENDVFCVYNSTQGCHGDSGSPLLQRKGDWWVVVGVYSFSYPSKPECTSGFNGIIKVSNHVDWILRVLAANQ